MINKEARILTCLEPVPPIIEASALNNPSLLFEYITENEDKSEVNFSIQDCLCGETSCSEAANCSCLVLSGGLFYLEPDVDQIDAKSLKQKVFFKECSNFCSCSEFNCKNRLIQNGVTKSLIVFHCGNDKNLGVKSGELIKKNSFVCEYTGVSRSVSFDHLSKPSTQKGSEEVNDKPLENNIIEENLKKHKYVLTLYEHFFSNDISPSVPTTKVTKTTIDASRKGNISRLINNSCSPNLYFLLIRTSSICPRACLFASRDINPGEELSYSYRDEGKDQISSSTQKCLCSSENCRGFMV